MHGSLFQYFSMSLTSVDVQILDDLANADVSLQPQYITGPPEPRESHDEHSVQEQVVHDEVPIPTPSPSDSCDILSRGEPDVQNTLLLGVSQSTQQHLESAIDTKVEPSPTRVHTQRVHTQEQSVVPKISTPHLSLPTSLNNSFPQSREDTTHLPYVYADTNQVKTSATMTLGQDEITASISDIKYVDNNGMHVGEDVQSESIIPPAHHDNLFILKRDALLELEKLRLLGIKLTRAYTMTDSYDDMMFELQAHRNNMDIAGGIQFMKSGLRVVLTGVEFTNSYAGSPLLLDNLTQDICSDMMAYNRVLEKVYVKYWQSHQSDPLIELGLLLCSSIFMQHFKNKVTVSVIQPKHKRPTMKRATS